jgi:hypothetical protein
MTDRILREWQRANTALEAETAIDEAFDPKEVYLFTNHTLEDGKKERVLNVLLENKLYRVLAYVVGVSESISVEQGETLLSAVMGLPMPTPDKVRILEAIVELNERSLNKLAGSHDRPIMVEEIDRVRADLAEMRKHRADSRGPQDSVGLQAIARELLKVQKDVTSCLRGEEGVIALPAAAANYPDGSGQGIMASLRSGTSYGARALGSGLASAAGWAGGFMRGRSAAADDPAATRAQGLRGRSKSPNPKSKH